MGESARIVELPVHLWVAIGGLLLGAAFGAVVHRTNFCMMGAIADMTLKQDTRRLRAWLLAIAVAIIGTQAVHLSGLVDITATHYLSPQLAWGGAIVGGLLFGFGMVIACGCGSRSLVNFGGGDLRALIAVVFLAIFAYMTMSGLAAAPRVMLHESASIDLAGHGLASQSIFELAGFTSPALQLFTGLLLAAVMIWYCFKDRVFRSTGRLIASGILIGALIPVGWLVTGIVGADEFEPAPVESFTFVAPVGRSLLYLMTFTGARVDFGVAVVGGVILGAFASALLNGSFKLRAFEDVYDLGRYMVGGALMGTGGIIALGCTVGQGITGVSTLGAGSWLALGAIITGGILGARYLEQGSLRDALRVTVADAYGVFRTPGRQG